MDSTDYTEGIDFQKYWLVLKRHWLPASSVFALIVTLATYKAATADPVYEAQGKLLFKKQNTTSALVTDAGAKIGQLDTLTQFNNPLDTEAEVISSMPIVKETVEALNFRDEQGKFIPPGDFLSQLNVKKIEGTDVLMIAFKSQYPKEAADAVNKLMDVYINNNILVNRREATAAREFIMQQLPDTEETVRQAEAALRAFKEENSVVSLQDEATSAVISISNLDSEVIKAQAQYEDATARSQALQSQMGLNPQQALAINTLSQSAAIQQVLTEYQKVQDQLAVQRTRYQSQHPIITNLERREAALNDLLQERVAQVLGNNQAVDRRDLQIGELQQQLTADLVNAEVQRLGLGSNVSALVRAQGSYRDRANALPRLEQQQRDLQRQLDAAQSAYQILLRNLQEVRIAENQNVGNARVISYATLPVNPVAPNKKLLVAAGVVGGSMLYVLTAFLLELMDPSIKTAKELRMLFRYTLLGMIPATKKRFGFLGFSSRREIPLLPTRDQPTTYTSEAYRTLQANLKFISPDREIRIIVVTSAVSQEGKSTVAANLAVATAQLGRRVLLIDGDMRHSTQHQIWNLTNVAGLSDVIANQAKFNIAVREVMENLDVLPSGATPPNPLALIDSKRMASLLEEFRDNYEFIIIDTPPFLLVADALALGKMTDGLLLVTRPGIIDTASAGGAREILAQSGQNVLGLVVNGVSAGSEPDGAFQRVKAYHKGKYKDAAIKKVTVPSESSSDPSFPDWDR
ncbi:MAG: polysaccharide biosynthesis tyrosine autokinase [Desertifilum sp.]|nr:polysaccharide biosynthesis tyrosine autokinase [Desertifilum sp.]MDI9640173.1 polysaccharide biosynthesis tyrosine autokinase [Geitlerinema splendidum]